MWWSGVVVVDVAVVVVVTVTVVEVSRARCRAVSVALSFLVSSAVASRLGRSRVQRSDRREDKGKAGAAGQSFRKGCQRRLLY